jgi:hypothetical protein
MHPQPFTGGFSVLVINRYFCQSGRAEMACQSAKAENINDENTGWLVTDLPQEGSVILLGRKLVKNVKKKCAWQNVVCFSLIGV